MKLDVYRRTRRIDIFGDMATSWVRRILPVVAFFLVAFAIDVATGRRYSSVWGSVAIIASTVSLFPAVRSTLAALGGYAAIWIGFNLVRAMADNAGVGAVGSGAVADVESALFGGALPTAYLQSQWFDPHHVDGFDVAMSVTHGSFFVTPFVMAVVIWWKRRAFFRQYTLATGLSFAIGLVGFLLLPTAPPWLSDPDEVMRVTRQAFAGESSAPVGSDARFWFEPNHLAAMPSVHVAAAVLVSLALKCFGRIGAIAGGVYVLAMTFAVVYLGEHFVLDALVGWVVAAVGWQLARWWFPEQQPREPIRRAPRDRLIVR